MTAGTMHTPRRIPWLTIAAAVLIVGSALPTISRHAIEGGPSHWSAYVHVNGCEPGDVWRGETPEGMCYIIKELDKLPGKPITWAVVILIIGCLPRKLRTCYLTQSRRQVDRLKGRCG